MEVEPAAASTGLDPAVTFEFGKEIGVHCLDDASLAVVHLVQVGSNETMIGMLVVAGQERIIERKRGTTRMTRTGSDCAGASTASGPRRTARTFLPGRQNLHRLV